jgi:uncharacterized protein YbjT (DUF2867 family)
MQNFSNAMAGTIKTQGVFYGTAEDSKTSYVDVIDIAAVAVKALTADGHQGMAYTITGPEAMSNKQVAEILSGVAGKQVTYIDLPEDEARKGMLDMGMSDRTVKVILEFSRAMKDGPVSKITHDVEQVTGSKPISFAQFANDYAVAFR